MNEANTAGCEDRVSVPDHIRFRQIDGELVIVDLLGGEYFALNAVGAKIWQGLAAGATPAEIASSLGIAYGIARDAALNDCLHLVKELVVRGLLTRSLP